MGKKGHEALTSPFCKNVYNKIENKSMFIFYSTGQVHRVQWARLVGSHSACCAGDRVSTAHHGLHGQGGRPRPGQTARTPPPGRALSAAAALSQPLLQHEAQSQLRQRRGDTGHIQEPLLLHRQLILCVFVYHIFCDFLPSGT